MVLSAHGGGCWPEPNPKGRGGDPSPSTDLKMVVWVNGFCGCRRCRRFCFRHTAEGNFFVLPDVSILKMLRG